MSLKPVGIRELQKQLIEVAARGSDPSPLLPKLDDEFRGAMQSQFQTGRGWKPLSVEYAAQKARQGKSPQIGVYSGGLRDSLVNANNPQHVTRFTRDKSFIVGSTDQIQRLFTGKHTKHKQPRRQIRLAPKMRRHWIEMAQSYIVEGTK